MRRQVTRWGNPISQQGGEEEEGSERKRNNKMKSGKRERGEDLQARRKISISGRSGIFFSTGREGGGRQAASE